MGALAHDVKNIWWKFPMWLNGEDGLGGLVRTQCVLGRNMYDVCTYYIQHVCMHVCMIIHSYMYTYVCIHTYVYTRILRMGGLIRTQHVHMYVWYRYLHTYIHTYAYTYFCIYVCMYIRICIHTYTYIMMMMPF